MDLNQHIKFNSPTIVHMFSGGLDSTAALFLLLTDPQYKDFHIHVHHVRIINIENRALAEIKAVQNILNFYRKNNFKSFTFSESSIYIPVYNSKFLFDVDITRFVAGFIAHSSSHVKRVSWGRTKTDDESPSGIDVSRANKIYNAFTESEPENKEATVLHPIRHLRKEEAMALLPKELISLTWSCRRPIWNGQIPMPCNHCKTCKQLHWLKL